MSRPASTSELLIAFGSIAFVLLISGIGMGFDAGELKFGGVIFLFVLGPIILAAIGSTVCPNQRDKSFQGKPKYMEGKRVKRRLWWLGTFGRAIEITGCFSAMWGMSFFKEISAVSCIAIVAAFFLDGTVYTAICVRLSWMTPTEAKEFLMSSQRWPRAWLEPDQEPQ